MKSIMKKTIALLCLTSMILSFFSFNIQASVAVPEVKTKKITEDFSGSSIPDFVSIASGTPSHKLEDNALVITGDKEDYTATRFNLGENSAGDWVIKLSLEKPNGMKDHCRVYLSGDEGNALYIQWVHNTTSLYAEGDTIARKSSSDYDSLNNLNILAHYDSVNKEFDLYVNDELFFDSVDVSSGTKFAINRVQITTNTLNAVCNVKSFEYYIPVPEPQDMNVVVQKDYDALSDEAILKGPLTESGYLVDDLNLIGKGTFGSDILWTTSDGDIIDCSTGYVTRGDSEKTVILKATISAGDVRREKSFEFKIPARGVCVDGYPEVINVGYRENFDALSGNMIISQGSGKVEIQDGKLLIETASNQSDYSSIKLYFNNSRTEINGKIAIECTMDSKTSERLIFYPNGNSTTRLTDIRWTEKMLSVYTMQNGSLKAQTFNTADFDAVNKVKVTLVIDTSTGIGSVLFNNKLAAENLPFKISGISHLYFFREVPNLKVGIDNIRVLYCEMDAGRKLAEDAASLSYESIFSAYEVVDGVIAKDVEFPTHGNFGSTISWQSSHSKIIGEDGTVTRPDEDTQVTLTATISSGSESVTKSFIITVLRSGDGDLFLLQQDYDSVTFESIVTEDVIADNYITKDLNLYTVCENGSSIRWSSSNESLISPSGAVKRPDNPEESMYVTLTATITNGDYSLDKVFELGVFPTDYDTSDIPVPDVFKHEYTTDFRKHIDEIDGDGECNTDENLGYVIDTWATARGRNGSITEYDGYVEIKRNSNVNNNETYLVYPLLPSTAYLGDIAMTQFKVEKTGKGQAQMQIGGGTGQQAVVYWNADDSFTISCKNKDGSGLEIKTKSYGKSADITFLTDSYTGTFSMWINGENVALGASPRGIGAVGLKQITFMLNNTNYITFKISNITTSYAYPFDHDIPKTDAEWLTEEIIRDGIPAPAKGKLSVDLNLVRVGKYGSDIQWQSSDESIISSDGTVKRPENINNETLVTLTAKLRYDSFETKKQFTFLVMPIYEADENITSVDADYLNFENYNVFSFTDTSADAVTTSLSLPDKGPYGSTYLWKTSDSRYLTSSGRVTRPRWDEGNKTVTLTAVIVYGSSVKTKEFIMTVLADEEIKDPKHMSDEEFFGVWSGDTWTTQSKFNYSYKGLEKVEAAAKQGNYELAKQELLSYMKSRGTSFLTGDLSRNTSYVNGFLLTGNYSSSYPKYYQASTRILSGDYVTYEVNVTANDIVRGGTSAFKIGARYNEDTGVYILSRESGSENSAKLVLTVDGVKKEYSVKADAVIRGGSNRYLNYGSEEEMEVRFFGDMEGEGTASVLLSFDTSTILSTSDVSEAKLVFTARLDEVYAENKDLIIYQANTEWNEDDVSLNGYMEYVYNFNGIPGGNHWVNIKTSENEYHFQACRQPFFKQAAAEYLYTGDEKYAYYIIRDSMDFIRDTQGTFNVSDILSKVVSTDWETLPDKTRRGAFPRALDIATRATGSVIPVLEIVLQSRYMTPDACTAMLKNLWDNGYELERWIADQPALTGNQVFFETQAYSAIAMFMPEFAYSGEYLENSLDTYGRLIKGSYFSDGSYIESTSGYTGSVLDMILTYWQRIKTYGMDFSDEIKEILKEAAMYNCVIKAPGGFTIPWGDQGKSAPKLTPIFPDYYKLTGDEEFNFVSTFGREGKMPSWTSRFYSEPLYAFMRSDWSDNALFALMSSSGFGGHGHADANAINVNAFGKYLLIDPGFYTYDSASPVRQYMLSTRGHNTVEVNNTSQKRISTPNIEEAIPQGYAHDWISNDKYDFYSVTSTAGIHADHRRTVTFVKPYFWIVSDLMTPYDETAENNYRQLWHMPADANLKHDDTDRTIYSDFATGANIIIASADTDAVIVEETGYDTVSWGIAADAKYGYYFKQNVKGKQTFDNIILPYDKTASAKAQHIDLGVPSYEATAMGLDVEISGNKSKVYYLLNYEHSSDTVRTLENYTTDAEFCLITEDEDGNITDVIMKNGSYIKLNGKDIISSGTQMAEAVSYTISGNTMEVISSGSIIAENLTIYPDIEVKNVHLNGNAIEFEKTDGVITLSTTTKEEIFEHDASSGKGGISSGAQGGAGNDSAGGGALVPGGNVSGGGNAASVAFSDISGHWAYDSIIAMAGKNIVNGDGTGRFNPDSDVTRAEIVTMAVRTLNLETADSSTPFEDVAPGSWYAPYVGAALNAGIISLDTRFRPDDYVTREEMSKILVITAEKYLDKEHSVPADYELQFADISSIGAWAIPYVKSAYHYGYINGVGDNTFAPKLNATRAQMATVLDRIITSR